MKEIKTWSLAFTYVGCFLGAGFISGQELWQFFGSFGNWGYVGFAAAAVLLLTILCSNLYTLIIAFYGTVYAGEWFVGYLGFTLQSLSFLSLDLLVSCFAKNQITGAVAGFGANFFLWMTDLLASNVSVSWLRDVLNFVSLYDRYEPFLLGQLSYASVLFFVSFIIVCLAGAVRVLDARRFGEGGAA